MKRLSLALLVLTAMFALSLYNTAQVSALSKQMVQRLNGAQQAASVEKWAKAERLTNEAQALWTSADEYISIVLRHSDADEVTTGFQEVNGFLHWREIAEYSSANGTLVEKVRHFAEVEAINWKNLL